MLSTLNHTELNHTEQDPHDVIEIAPDIVLAARADKPSVTPATGTFGGPSAPEVRIGPAAGDSTPSVDTTFRATTLDDFPIRSERSSFAKWVIRTSFACLFAICSAVAAAAWQHYGDRAQQMLADWTPPRINLSSLFSSDKPTAPEPSATSVAAAAQAPAQAVSVQPAPTAPSQPAPATPVAQDTAAAAPSSMTTAASSDAQLMQSMAHDITAMSQQIADLKTSIDQLRTRQEQMSRDLAKAAEARIAEAKAAEAKAVEMRAFERQKIVPPHAARAPVRRPRPVYTPVQASAVPPPPPAAAAPLPSSQPIAPLPPPQATVQPDGDPVVRPPMPLR
jgi:hypothetical protein